MLTCVRNATYRLATMEHNYLEYLPLSPATVHVLLALANGDLHGYGILLEVKRQSSGAYKMGPGTLYDNLKRLLSEELVEEIPAKGRLEKTRREYRLTSLGCDVLRAETERLSKVIKVARRSLRLAESTRA